MFFAAFACRSENETPLPLEGWGCLSAFLMPVYTLFTTRSTHNGNGQRTFEATGAKPFDLRNQICFSHLSTSVEARPMVSHEAIYRFRVDVLETVLA